MKKSRTLTVCAVAMVASLSIGIHAWAQDDEKGPPLPFITIEGSGGGSITPMAYLVNPAKDGELFGKPSFAMDYIGLGQKNMETLLLTENLGGRLEFGFAADRLGLGTLPTDINTAFSDPNLITNSDVWLYNFSVRGLVVKENAGENTWIPAITVGATAKYNSDIGDINRKLGYALNTIGYKDDTSVDFTLTGTKTFGTAFFGRPLIVTAGLRESEAANLGFLGFSDTYHASFEGNIAALPFDKLLIAYEFRQKTSPYTMDLAPLIGTENNWHAFDVAYIMNKHTTMVAGAGIFGNLANAKANNAWFLQLKHEF